MEKDKYKFVTAIHIDNQKFPKIKEDNLGSLIAGYVEKMGVIRVKAFDSAIIDNIREIGRENGIDLLAIIDEEKLLNIALKLEEQDKVLKIIKEKTLTINDLYWLKNGDYREYRKNLETLYSGVEEEHLQKILKTQEEFNLLKEYFK